MSKNINSKTKNTTNKSKKSQESKTLQSTSTNDPIDLFAQSKCQSNLKESSQDFVAIASMLNEAAQKILEYNMLSKGDASFQIWQTLDQLGQTIKSTRDKISRPYSLVESKHVQFWYDREDDNSFSSCMTYNHIEDNYKKGEFYDEIRSYYVPAASVRKEHEALCQYNKDNIPELLQTICTDLLSITTLLAYLNNKSTSIEELSTICKSICSPVLTLREICSQLTKSTLIYKRIA